jgi:hypothetical protein
MSRCADATFVLGLGRSQFCATLVERGQFALERSKCGAVPNRIGQH